MDMWYQDVAAQLDPPGIVRRHGSRLFLNGKPYWITGINAPQAATDYEVNAGCGAPIDLDALFAQLPPNAVVRVGFSQDMTINAKTGLRDWSGTDQVVAAAEDAPTHPKLIIGLTSQSGTCDSGLWKNLAWYAGGWRSPTVGTDGRPRVAYSVFLDEIVRRYAASTAIAYWEPVGEPEPTNCPAGLQGVQCYGQGTCPTDATAVLRQFFDNVGEEIRAIDPYHPIADGAISEEQCGWTGGGTRIILGSPGIDIATYHDYGDDATAMPAGLAPLLADAAAVGKPAVVDEAGISARDEPGCKSTAIRAIQFRSKMNATRSAGVAGFVPWDYGVDDTTCDTRIGPGDPLFTVLAQ